MPELLHRVRPLLGLAETTSEIPPEVVIPPVFERRRDLFSELSVVFMDTTSLYFEARHNDAELATLAREDGSLLPPPDSVGERSPAIDKAIKSLATASRPAA
mgnify:CR=1 FL=1